MRKPEVRKPNGRSSNRQQVKNEYLKIREEKNMDGLL
jgi:hypothetical protein